MPSGASNGSIFGSSAKEIFNNPKINHPLQKNLSKFSNPLVSYLAKSRKRSNDIVI
jgi:hypothetical protein